MARHLAVVLLLLGSAAWGQKVKPTDLTIDAVPGYTSPPQNVTFSNTGSTALTLAVSLTGSFAMPTNHCGKAVKPGTHCNVDITYSPQAAEMDYGTLTFTFNNQTVSLPLTGNATIGVLWTSLRIAVSRDGVNLKVTSRVDDPTRGYVIPDGSWIQLQCWNANGQGNWSGGDTVKGVIYVPISIFTQSGGTGPWGCEAYYDGNGEFASAYVDQYNFWF